MSFIQNKIEMKYHKIIYLILLTITALPILNTGVINNIIVIICSILILILVLQSNFKINFFIIWKLLVALIILLSITWSIDVYYAIGQNKQHLLISAMTIYLTLIIRTKEDIYTALVLFVISRLVLLIYIIIIIDFSTLGNMRIGAASLGEEWNANEIGMNFAFAAFAIIVLLKKQSTKITQISFYTMLLLFTSITLLTGSRKAFLILVFTITLYLILLSGKKIITNSIYLIILSIGLYYLIMNVSLLYDVLGERIEGLIASFIDSGSGDASTEERRFMIQAGIMFFKENPLIGYGINNYRVLLGQLIGDYIYSHNNYVELLVGIGIFGTLIYYSVFYTIIKKAIQNLNELTLFGLITVITILIIDYGLVSYNSYYINFFICLAYSTIHISNKKRF